ncbi:MAG: hypothetical protein V1668_03750 [Patescibacteria group bacterium]
MYKFVYWVRRNLIVALLLFIAFAWSLRDTVAILPPTVWRFLVIGAVAIVMLVLAGWFAAVYLRQIRTERRGRHLSGRMAGRNECSYECPACGGEWREDKLPKDCLCPLDHIPLHSRDPVEDRNCERL